MTLRKIPLILCLTALFLWLVRYHPPGVDHFIYDGDASQHVYWTAKYQNPDLFENDLLTDFITTTGFDPVGYRLIYRLGVQAMDPLPFSRLLSLILLLLSLWLLDDLAKGLIADDRGRFFCGLLFLLFSLYDASGGFPRSFAFPLLLAFLGQYQRGRYKTALGACLASAVLYPPVILNLLAVAGWDAARRFFAKERSGKFWADAVGLALVVAVSGAFLVSVYGDGAGHGFGEKVGLEAAREMPEFHPDGRKVFFRESLFQYLLVAPSGIGVYRLIGFAVILAVMVSVAGVRRTKIPPLAVHLTWTSLVLFTAAHLVLFRLHHPSRYTLYTLPLAFILTIGANTGAFLDRLKPLWKALPHRLPLLGKRGWGWLLLALAALAYTYAQGHYFSRLDMATLDPPDLQLMEFLRTLPEDALVAGHPCVMDAVPLLARRKVLANHELSLPYYYGYYGRIRKRITDFFEAYYAGSRETVEAFARGYGVDVLVVRKEHFDPAFLEGKIYYEPFNKAVKGRLKEGGGFVLQTPAPEKWAASGASEVCFENRRYFALCF